jgi:multicomponent Na+:H+ antiporter subunit D
MTALVSVLALPLAGAMAAVALPGRAGRAAAATATVATAFAAAALAAAVATNGPIRLTVGGWAPPLGIALEADGVAAVFLTMTALVMAP